MGDNGIDNQPPGYFEGLDQSIGPHGVALPTPECNIGNAQLADFQKQALELQDGFVLITADQANQPCEYRFQNNKLGVFQAQPNYVSKRDSTYPKEVEIIFFKQEVPDIATLPETIKTALKIGNQSGKLEIVRYHALVKPSSLGPSYGEYAAQDTLAQYLKDQFNADLARSEIKLIASRQSDHVLYQIDVVGLHLTPETSAKPQDQFRLSECPSWYHAGEIGRQNVEIGGWHVYNHANGDLEGIPTAETMAQLGATINNPRTYQDHFARAIMGSPYLNSIDPKRKLKDTRLLGFGYYNSNCPLVKATITETPSKLPPVQTSNPERDKILDNLAKLDPVDTNLPCFDLLSNIHWSLIHTMILNSQPPTSHHVALVFAQTSQNWMHRGHYTHHIEEMGKNSDLILEALSNNVKPGGHFDLAVATFRDGKKPLVNFSKPKDWQTKAGQTETALTDFAKQEYGKELGTRKWASTQTDGEHYLDTLYKAAKLFDHLPPSSDSSKRQVFFIFDPPDLKWDERRRKDRYLPQAKEPIPQYSLDDVKKAYDEQGIELHIVDSNFKILDEELDPLLKNVEAMSQNPKKYWKQLRAMAYNVDTRYFWGQAGEYQDIKNGRIAREHVHDDASTGPLFRQCSMTALDALAKEPHYFAPDFPKIWQDFDWDGFTSLGGPSKWEEYVQNRDKRFNIILGALKKGLATHPRLFVRPINEFYDALDPVDIEKDWRTGRDRKTIDKEIDAYRQRLVKEVFAKAPYLFADRLNRYQQDDRSPYGLWVSTMAITPEFFATPLFEMVERSIDAQKDFPSFALGAIGKGITRIPQAFVGPLKRTLAKPNLSYVQRQDIFDRAVRYGAAFFRDELITASKDLAGLGLTAVDIMATQAPALFATELKAIAADNNRTRELRQKAFQGLEATTVLHQDFLKQTSQEKPWQASDLLCWFKDNSAELFARQQAIRAMRGAAHLFANELKTYATDSEPPIRAATAYAMGGAAKVYYWEIKQLFGDSNPTVHQAARQAMQSQPDTFAGELNQK